MVSKTNGKRLVSSYNPIENMVLIIGIRMGTEVYFSSTS